MEKLHSLLPKNVMTRASRTVWTVFRTSGRIFFLLWVVEVHIQILQH